MIQFGLFLSDLCLISIKHVYFSTKFLNCYVTYLLYILLFRLSVCDWFYIRQAYFVASIGSMEFYNK
jgi:hypothetical protein